MLYIIYTIVQYCRSIFIGKYTNICFWNTLYNMFNIKLRAMRKGSRDRDTLCTVYSNCDKVNLILVWLLSGLVQFFQML